MQESSHLQNFMTTCTTTAGAEEGGSLCEACPSGSHQQPTLGICKVDKAFLQVLLRGEHVVMVAAALP